MTPSRYVVEEVGALVAAGAFAPQLDLPLPSCPTRSYATTLGSGTPGSCVELDLDADVVTLDQVLPLPAPGQARLPQRDPHPGERERERR